MEKRLKVAFENEMRAARTAWRDGALDLAFHHLERAHVLGQRNFWPHWISHWWMLKVGLRRNDGREVRGQILRLAAVGPARAFGWVPLGNTGGANVSALKPMDIPADLSQHFE